ncbi:MAG: hypothetical protein ACRDPB_03410 [Nocardioidaceae bacterium]
MQPDDSAARRTTMKDSSLTRRWLAPVAASVAVLALFIGLWWAGTASTASRQAAQQAQQGRNGSALVVAGDRASGTEVPPPFDASGGGPVALPDPTSSLRPLPKRVLITGYRTSGRTLSLDYTIGIASCYGRIATPKVAESADTVIVMLHRLPTAQSKDRACPDLALLETVDVDLAGPVGDRVVKDGATGKTVPRLPVG